MNEDLAGGRSSEKAAQNNRESGTRRRVGFVLEAGFLIVAIVLPTLGPRFGLADPVGDLSISFVAIVLEALPFLLLGTLIGGVIEAFVPHEVVRRSLGKGGTRSIFVAATLGFLFPVCECAIVPVTKRLMNKGVPLAPAVAFLLAIPIVNPVVAASTAVAYRFDWTFVIARLVCGYLVAVGTALLVKFLWGRGRTVVVNAEHVCATCCADHHEHAEAVGLWAKSVIALRHGCDDFFGIAHYLIIGAFIAAAARTFIGMDAFARFGEFPLLAILIMMLWAVALNLCSEADAFIAAAFRGALPPSAQLAFMTLGPMLDVKLALMYSTVFKKRAIVVIGASVFIGVFICMAALEYGFGGMFFGA